MKVFSKYWFKYHIAIRTNAFKRIAEERKNGVDFTHFDLYERWKRNYLFIHIPKAGGVSLVHALTGSQLSNHAKAVDYKKQNVELFDKYIKFSVVRHPLTRCLSAYNYLKKGGRQNRYDYFWLYQYIYEYKTFDSFVQEGGLSKAITGNAEHFIPQHEFLYDGSQCLVDLWGKLENMNEFSKKLEMTLSVSLDIKKLNTSDYQTKSLSNTTVSEVERIYKKDYESFGY